MRRFCTGMETESREAKSWSRERVMVRVSSALRVVRSTDNSLAYERRTQNAEFRIKKRSANHRFLNSAFCVLRSAFSFIRSPPHPTSLRPYAPHARQLFLFLLLHGAQERFGVRLAFGLLLRLPVARRGDAVGMIWLLLRALLLLVLIAAAARLLLLLRL